MHANAGRFARHLGCTQVAAMNFVEQEARARRREVGRTLLALGRALSATLAIFNQSKEDPAARIAAKEACDDALREMRRSFEALWQFRKSLDRSGDAHARIDRPSLAH
jgi:hypothetical protein